MTPMDQEIMLPNSVTRNSRATMPTSTPPVRPVIRDTASMRPESTLMSRVGTAAPMPKAENR